MVLFACLVVINIQCIYIDISGMLFYHSLLFQRTIIQCMVHVARDILQFGKYIFRFKLISSLANIIHTHLRRRQSQKSLLVRKFTCKIKNGISGKDIDTSGYIVV